MIHKVIEKIRDKVEDIVDFFVYNPFNIRTHWERIIGTLRYAMFIWKNHSYREWDFAYLYDLIEFKLERMAIQLKKDDYVADSHTRYEEIQKALSFLHVYNNIEDESYNNNNVDSIREIYKQQQRAWENFHDTLKDNAQKWWS